MGEESNSKSDNDNATSMFSWLMKPMDNSHHCFGKNYIVDSTKFTAENETISSEEKEIKPRPRFSGFGTKWMPSRPVLIPQNTITNQAILYQFGPHLIADDSSSKSGNFFKRMMSKKYDDSWFLHEMYRLNVIC